MSEGRETSSTLSHGRSQHYPDGVPEERAGLRWLVRPGAAPAVSSPRLGEVARVRRGELSLAFRGLLGGEGSPTIRVVGWAASAARAQQPRLPRVQSTP
eukprot:6816992-Pyramimonas_sp.AAC.1